MLCKTLLLLLMVDPHFEIFTRVFYFLLQVEILLESVVKEDYFTCLFVRKSLSNLFKSLRTSQQFYQESFDILVRPNITLFVLHLII